jgi:hypothetical protein
MGSMQETELQSVQETELRELETRSGMAIVLVPMEISWMVSQV